MPRVLKYTVESILYPSVTVPLTGQYISSPWSNVYLLIAFAITSASVIGLTACSSVSGSFVCSVTSSSVPSPSSDMLALALALIISSSPTVGSSTGISGSSSVLIATFPSVSFRFTRLLFLDFLTFCATENIPNTSATITASVITADTTLTLSVPRVLTFAILTSSYHFAKL